MGSYMFAEMRERIRKGYYLGFTFITRTSHKGEFIIVRKTSNKKMRRCSKYQWMAKNEQISVHSLVSYETLAGKICI